MPKFNAENMLEELDTFGKAYKYPVYVSVTDPNGLFSSNRNVKSGYAAISDDYFLLLAEIPTIGFIGDTKYCKLPISGISRLKIKKAPLINLYIISVKGIADGKKYKIKLNLSCRGVGNSFPDQAKNGASFLEKMTKWSKEI